MSESDIALSIALGIGLAAASGFRVFLPMLVLSISASAGYVPLSVGFAWLASTAAVTMLSVAALAEILAYYIPGADNILDGLAGPAALVAGVILAASVMTDVSPMLKWTLAIIAGGGAAGLTQGATTVIRAHSTVLTAGIGNSIVATVELVGALVLSILAVASPFIALALAMVLGLLAFRVVRKITRRRASPER